MFSTEGHFGEICLNETVEFVQRSLHAPAAIFGWIAPDRSFQPAKVSGLGPELVPQYLAGMHRYDPLDIYRLINERVRIAFRQDERMKIDDDRDRIYTEFLNGFGISDEVNLIFWQGDNPIAILGVMRQPGDLPFAGQDFQWGALHRFIEFTLQQHPHACRRRVHDALRGRYGLTMREIEVTELLGNGASNADIAACLSIELSTTKTHIINILNKLGVDNRGSAAAFLDIVKLSLSSCK